MRKVAIIAATIAATFTVTLAAFGKDYTGDTYSVYTQDGVRLCLCDNRTPGNYEDDFVIDWEDNRDIDIIIND